MSIQRFTLNSKDDDNLQALSNTQSEVVYKVTIFANLFTVEMQQPYRMVIHPNTEIYNYISNKYTNLFKKERYIKTDTSYTE